jgi:two-component sensor histidine kinase
MHELSTNAAKYGALSVATGCVQIEWSRLPDDRFVLRWTESDGPSVEASRGFGMRVIVNKLTTAVAARPLDSV